MTEVVWAPWRMTYILGEQEAGAGRAAPTGGLLLVLYFQACQPNPPPA